jgi:hypothetical protein
VDVISARTIMNNLLADIFSLVHNLPKHRTEEVAIFSGLNTHRPTIEEMLMVEDSFQLSAATQLLSLYCLHKGRSVSAQLLKFLLGSYAKEQQLVVLVQLVGRWSSSTLTWWGRLCTLGSGTRRLI